MTWRCAHRNTNTHLNTSTYRANVLDEFTEGRRRFDLLFVGDDEVLSKFWNQKTIGIESSKWQNRGVGWGSRWGSMTDHPCVHVFWHISIYSTLLRKWAILTEGVWWQGCNQKLDNFHVGYVEVHRLKAASPGSLQNFSSPFPGCSNDIEHLVCMVFCDNHSIYRTLRFIIKCGNGKSTATVTNGRLEGIWVFTNQTSIILYLAISMKMPKAPGSQSHQRRPKKKGRFSSPFGWFWVVKVYHWKFRWTFHIRSVLSVQDLQNSWWLRNPAECSLSCYLQRVLYIPKKVLLRPIAHQHDSRILHPFSGCQGCYNSGPPNHANVFQAIRAMSLQEGVGSGWFFGLERPKVWEVFLESFLGNLWNVGPFPFCEATKPQMFVEILVFQSVEDTLRDEVFVIPNDISTTWKSGWASLLAIWKLPLITFARDSLRFASSMVGKSLIFSFKFWMECGNWIADFPGTTGYQPAMELCFMCFIEGM